MLTLACTICFAFMATANDNQGHRYLQPGPVIMAGYFGMPPFEYLNIPFQNNEPLHAAPEEEFEGEKETFIETEPAESEEKEDVEEQSTLSSGNIDGSPKSKGTTIPNKIHPKNTKTKPLPDDDSLSAKSPSGSESSSFLNTFFPIILGGKSGVRGKSGDHGSNGGTTAIANSFSTGRGGVASSHATSFGDVYLSAALRDRKDRLRENI